nr:hypothetical protein [Actinomycetota bacterium]
AATAAGAGRDGSAARGAAPVATRRTHAGRSERIRFRGMTRVLTPKALAAYEQLTSGDVAAGEVEQLLSLLPTELADSVRQALTTAKVAEKTVKDTVATVVPRPSKAKARAAAKAGQQPNQPKEEPTSEPKEEPSPEPSPTEEPEEDEDPDDTSGLPKLGTD